MSSQWKKCLLGDLIDLKRGYDLPASSRIPGDCPIVSSSGVTGSHFEAKVKAPGVVTGRYGTLGQVFYLQEDFWPLNTSLYVRDFKGNHPKFIAYFLGSLGLENSNAAGAVPGLNRNHLHQLEVSAPDYEGQRRIASILSAYDDLIENNTRRIEILEEMARRLYEEWFVHFRFPGHEEASFNESEQGRVPEGWGVKPVADTFQILGGGTPSKKVPEYWDEGHINWFSPTDLTRSSTSFVEESSSKITNLGLKKSSAKLFPAYSVMMTSRATIGVVAINTQPASTNQGFITCLPSSEFPCWLMFHWLKENVERFISLGTGATFKEISKGVFKEIQLVVPPRLISGAFEESVAPMMKQVEILQRKNRNLRVQRDLLLPKLVSGEIDVSNLPMPHDKEVQAA
jgi:type I restriction enzyme S subunit